MATDPICGMNVKPSSPFRISKGNETFYFCGKYCLEKFSSQEGLPVDSATVVASPARPLFSFLKNKNFIAATVLLALSVLSYVFTPLESFRLNLAMYFRMIWWAIVLGLVIGGFIEYYVPREFFTYLLAQPKRRTIFYAVFLGFWMSVCSHGILAIAMQLHKKGASTPAVIAFLLASPWANFPLTLMLIGFFGLAKALYIICSAIVVAVVTGFLYQALEGMGWVERNKNTVTVAADYSLWQDIQTRIRGYHFSKRQCAIDAKGILRGGVALGNMVLWWIFIGIGLAAAFGAYVPHEIFQRFMGPGLKGLFTTLGFATVIETCSEGSAPVAFEIFRQTRAVGNSLVFLMAGVVTNFSEIGLIWHNVGRRAAFWLPVVTVPQVLLLGILANHIF